MRRFASALLAGAAIALIAAAPASARSPFDGAYVGGYAGYGLGNADTTVGAIADEGDLDGFTFGGYAGYGQTFDGFYLGAEGEVGYSLQDGDLTSGTATADYEADWTYGLALRAGYLVTRDVLVYGRVGYQWQGIEGTLANAPLTVDFDETFDGWRFGGGVETALSKTLLARVEYTYTDYGTFEPDVTIGGTAARISPDDHAVRVGVAYRF